MEKKRRPRLVKPGSDFSTDRPKKIIPDDKREHEKEQLPDRKPFEEQEKKPFDSDRPRPFERRDENPGSERKPWQDRNSSGERKPFDSDRPQRPYDPDRQQRPNNDPDRPQRPYERREGSGNFGERKPYDPDRPQRPYERREGGSNFGERKPYDPDRPQRPYERREGGSNFGERKPYDPDRPQRPYERREGGSNFGERKPYDPNRPQRPYERREGGSGGGSNFGERKPYDPNRPQRPYERREGGGGGGFGGRDQRGGGFKKPFGKKPFGKKEEFYVERKPKPGLPSGEGMPLNKYLAHCGVASRRKAVDYITEGKVTVNGELKKEPYYRVQPNDNIICDGKDMKVQERQVYILLNKPKDVITTTEDEHGRATVLDIVDPHFPERVYPVGRLDRDTTGLLLITNDGDLAQKLAHPSHQIKKQYRIGLDRPLSQSDFERIENGMNLEDGEVTVSWVRFSEDHPERDVVELEIVIGRNRIVRRMFESLGYRVRKLDRFYYAGLTKRELPRGNFRELTQREVIMLKHFSGNPPTPSKKFDKNAPDEDISDDEFNDAEIDDNVDEVNNDVTTPPTMEDQA
jgi:23S rRNA pseudouridine2605 synthase